jgi:hypothetical protein
MKNNFILVFFFLSLFCNAQKIRFTYDASGNQILRTVCPGCSSKNSQTPLTSEYSKLENESLQKFFPEDVISYYPNPVLDELFIKWDLTNDNNVIYIEIFGINGQVLKKIDSLVNQNSHVINFSQYPAGIYFVNLNYAIGEPKTIKILKN